MMKRPFAHLGLSALTIVATISAIASAHATQIRVGVSQDTAQVTVGSSTAADIVDGTGRVLGELPALEGFVGTAIPGSVQLRGHSAWQILVRPRDNGMVYIGDRWYRGTVRLVRSGTGMTVVNTVDLEDYLSSVIGKEMYTTWPIEALKAQAVASRSYVLFRQQKPKYKLFDVLNTTTSQVYGGLDSEAESTQTAVKATQGEVLTHNGKVIEAVFHSASGGHTENSENVWQSPVPYLRGVPDFDQQAPVYQWTMKFNASQMQQRLPGVGQILALQPVQTSPTGRVRMLKIQGDAGSRLIQGSQLRKALGLKSTLFAAQPQFGLIANQPGTTKPTGFLINGRGYGHGLGMSQWGAFQLSKQGKTYRDILAHYYQGTQLQKF